MAKRNRSTASVVDHSQCLCEAHAHAFALSEGEYIRVQAAHEQGEDEPIECERCSLAVMRRAGAL